MTNLMEPLEEPQLQLLNVVWPLFIQHGRFPVFNYVDHRMRESGLDAGEVIDSLPFIQYGGARGRYSAVWSDRAGGGVAQRDSPICLTMAGLYHIEDHAKMPIVHAVLTYLRSMSAARAQIADHPFDVPRINVTLKQALKPEGIDQTIIPWVSAVAQREWLAMRVTPQLDQNDATGELGVLTEANFFTIEEYLNALTAVTTPQQPTAILEYRDPRALGRSITNFDIACELVLKSPLVKKPAIDRTALFALDAATYSDLQTGISALGELMSGLDVPGKNPSYATGRLLVHLVHKLPNIDMVRIQEAIDLMDAAREMRNSGAHLRPSAALIAAHDTLGLPFPIRDPAQAWNIIRAQMEAAFGTLQEEIYAARPV